MCCFLSGMIKLELGSSMILQTVFGELHKLKSMGDVPRLPCGFFVINIMADDRFKIESCRRETKILLRQKRRLARSCLDIEPSETHRNKIILNENNSFTYIGGVNVSPFALVNVPPGWCPSSWTLRGPRWLRG